MPDGDLLARLRTATRPIHDRLDALAPFATPTRYAAFLHAMLAGHRPLIDALGDGQRETVRRLEDDLAELGESPQGVIDVPTAFASEGTPGVRYVVLGSRFGASAMLSGVRSSMPDAPTRFLAGGGDDAASWRRFKAELDEVPPEASLACERAAIATFGSFEAALRHHLEIGSVG